MTLWLPILSDHTLKQSILFWHSVLKPWTLFTKVINRLKKNLPKLKEKIISFWEFWDSSGSNWHPIRMWHIENYYYFIARQNLKSINNQTLMYLTYWEILPVLQLYPNKAERNLWEEGGKDHSFCLPYLACSQSA